jgi:hypothetical protein
MIYKQMFLEYMQDLCGKQMQMRNTFRSIFVVVHCTSYLTKVNKYVT